MKNMDKLRKEIVKNDLDGILISSNINRLYTTGFKSSAGLVLVTNNNAWLLTDSRYLEAAQREISDIEVVLVNRGETYYQHINQIAFENELKVLGFEEENVTFAEYQEWKLKLNIELHIAQSIINILRRKKSRPEFEKLLEVQQIAEKSFEEILPIISKDITEKELAAKLVYTFIKNGADDKSFDPIIVSGTHSSMPHGVPTNNLIQEGFLTIDFGARKNGWCSDTTRTVCVGEPTKEMVLVYDTVLKAQLAGIDILTDGIKCHEVDKAARNLIEEAGYGKYFNHGFGHGLGLEVHEIPFLKSESNELLKEGDVITAEPGIYIPGQFGVRIEDTLYITKDGSENLASLSKQLIVI